MTPVVTPSVTDSFGAQMARALELLGHVGRQPEEHAVHRLRVTVRRCRTVAATMLAIDTDRGWRDVERISHKLFKALGELRDLQVARATVASFSREMQSGVSSLITAIDRREAKSIRRLQRQVHAFDAAHWRQLGRRLAPRADVVVPDGPAARSLVYGKLRAVQLAERAAAATPSAQQWHALRISLKRLRYTMEQLAPMHYADWGADLRAGQDLLGEVHDLDAFGALMEKAGPISDAPKTRSLRILIGRRRAARLRDYRRRVSDDGNFLREVSRSLLAGERMSELGKAQLEVAGRLLTRRDLTGQRQVNELCERVFESLSPVFADKAEDAGRLLVGAALLVGSRPSSRRHSAKKSAQLIRCLEPPPGWTKRDVEVISLIVRQALRRDPRLVGHRLERFTAHQRQMVLQVAAVLRLILALRDAGIESGSQVATRLTADALELSLEGPSSGRHRALTSAQRTFASALGRAASLSTTVAA